MKWRPLALLLFLLASACARDTSLLGPDGLRPSATLSSLTRISPDSAMAGDAYVEVTVHGSGFNEWSTVTWDGATLYPMFVDDSTLVVPLWGYPYLAEAGTHTIQVHTPDDGYTDGVPFTVYNPRPAITSMTPDSAPKDGSVNAIVIEGTNFVPGSRVLWEGQERTAYVDGPTQIRVYPNWNDFQEFGQTEVRVVSPGPGGGESEPVYFRVAPRLFLHTHGAQTSGVGFRLEVQGEGFQNGAAVFWNGQPLTTQFVRSTELIAWVPSYRVETPGAGEITVQSASLGSRPWKVGTVAVRPTPPASVTSQVVLDLPVRDLVYDSARERIYATVYDGPNAGSLAVIDPAAGAVVDMLPLGQDPRYLALSSDGKWLWAGVDGENRIRRFNLQWNWWDWDISLELGHVAGDLAAMPGSQEIVVVSLRDTSSVPRHRGVRAYQLYWPLANATAAGAGSTAIEFGMAPSELYGLNADDAFNRLYYLKADEQGVATTGLSYGLSQGLNTDIAYAAGRVYSSGGLAVDLEMRDWAGFFQASGAVRPDVETGRVFFLGTGGIKVADMNTFATLATIPVPPLAFEPIANQRRTLIRWGSDGLAYHDADQVILVRSPIVAP